VIAQPLFSAWRGFFANASVPDPVAASATKPATHPKKFAVLFIIDEPIFPAPTIAKLPAVLALAGWRRAQRCDSSVSIANIAEFHSAPASRITV